jgi:Protein of unknown function (DUF1116)
MAQPNTGYTDRATAKSAAAAAAVAPVLSRAGRLDAFRDIGPRTLLHAGPPIADPAAACRPILNAAAAVAQAEGWARDAEEAAAMIAAGAISLRPAQDFGAVVPLAFVAGPGTAMLQATDGKAGGADMLVSVNDGPPAGALRFGAPGPAAAGHLRHLAETVAPALDRALDGAPLPLIPIAARALAAGDDLHGQVAASSAEIIAILRDRIGPGPASDTIAAANQFFLNPWMAACALMIRAGAGVAESAMVVAAGGNGREAGVKLAARPDRWITFPARPPQGPRLNPSLADRPALPAIGDSVVIDACGFGAQAIAFAPDLRAAFGDAVPASLPDAPAALLRAPHPGFAPLPIRVGLDLRAATTAAPFCATLAILDADGGAGLIGRGIAVIADDGPALAATA